jgi:2-methylcitrate dehydratase PrpD
MPSGVYDRNHKQTEEERKKKKKKLSKAYSQTHEVQERRRSILKQLKQRQRENVACMKSTSGRL